MATHTHERAGGSIVLLRVARRAAARYRRVPMDQSRGCRVAHTAAAAAVVVEQEIVRVVRAAAVDPRDRTAHHNQARPLEPNSKGKLASLIIFKGLQCKKIVMCNRALYLTKCFDIFFPLTEGCSEGLGAF